VGHHGTGTVLRGGCRFQGAAGRTGEARSTSRNLPESSGSPAAAQPHSNSYGALDLARIAGRAVRRRAGTSITGGSGPLQNIGIVDSS
jgi:hypothetical protein